MTKTPFKPRRQLYTLSPSDHILKAIDILEQSPPIGSVMVVTSGYKLVGIITRRDVKILRRSALDPECGVRVGEIMTKKEYLACVPDGTTHREVLQILNQRRIEQVAVVDNEGRLVDVISLKDIIPTEPQCFVLMPFKEPYFTIYTDHILEPLRSEFRIKISKADDIFTAEPIINAVQKSIRDADCLIADITEKNPNVYYEIGYAHAVERPIIFTTQNVETVPFDIAHLRYIKYEYTPRGMEIFEEELKRALRKLLDDIKLIESMVVSDE